MKCTLIFLVARCVPIQNSSVTICYFVFWLVEDLAELVDGPTGSVEVARGGCLFAWNFTVARSTVLTERRY
jgi:hypothetical protein